MSHSLQKVFISQLLRLPPLMIVLAVIFFVVGCGSPDVGAVNDPVYDKDPHADLNIIENYETARLRNQAPPETEPDAPAPNEIEENLPSKVVRTSHFDFSNNRVYDFLRLSLQTKLSKFVPFTKWVPEAFANNVVTYQTYGLSKTENDVFDQIMVEFMNYTGLPLVRNSSGGAANLNFAYVQFLIEAQQLPPFVGKLDDQIEHENKHLLEFPLEGERPVRRWSHKRFTNGESVMSAFYMARPAFHTESGNTLAGYFVKDIYQGLTGTVLMKNSNAVSIGTPVEGPVYSWEIPMINYLLIHSMYQPNIRSGISKVEAVSLVLNNMLDEMNRARIVELKSTYTPE